MAELIITNGDAAAELLKLAGRDGTILPWRDVLHEGPIAGPGLAACSRLRVDYLAHRFGLPLAGVEAEFAERDRTIAAYRSFDAIELWFEHDLYDQLQLVQVLAFFAAEAGADGLILIQADEFLGCQRPETILRLADRARPVDRADLDFAASVWRDLAAPTPEAIAKRIGELGGRLPFLKSALGRFLDELPAPRTGLSRSEQAILTHISRGLAAPADLFRAVLADEEAAFMGDWSFLGVLDDLASCAAPLIAGLAPRASGVDAERFADARLELTTAGDDVISGEADHVALSGLDRWWAGTRLRGRSVWRYDRGERRLVPPAPSGA